MGRVRVWSGDVGLIMNNHSRLIMLKERKPVEDRWAGQSPVMGSDLRERMTRVMLASAPSDFARIVVSVESVAALFDVTCWVYLADGRRYLDSRVPAGVGELLDEFRDRCFRTGIGTWYSARLILERDSELIAVLDYDRLPGMVHELRTGDEYEPAADELLLDDQWVYPRDVQHLHRTHPSYLDTQYPEPLVVEALSHMLPRHSAELAGVITMSMSISAAMYYTEATITSVTETGTTTTSVTNVLDPRVVASSRRVHLALTGLPWYTAEVILPPDDLAYVEFRSDVPPFGGLWSADNPSGDAHPEMLRNEQMTAYPASPDDLPAWHPSRARTLPVSILRLEVVRQGVEEVLPPDWRHVVIDFECVDDRVRARIRDLADPEQRDYGPAFEADQESVDSVNALRLDAHLRDPAGGSWYSARLVMDQPDHPDRILVEELDFLTRPFTKIPRPGEKPDASELRELLMGDESRYTRDEDRLPQWHPAREG